MQSYALWDHEQELQALTGASAGSRGEARLCVLVSYRCSCKKAHWGRKLLCSGFRVVISMLCTRLHYDLIWNTVWISVYNLSNINLRWNEWEERYNGLSSLSYERKLKVRLLQVRINKGWERIWLSSTDLPEEKTLRKGEEGRRALWAEMTGLAQQHFHIRKEAEHLWDISCSKDNTAPITCF